MRPCHVVCCAQAAARQLQELCDPAPCCDLQLKLMASELQGGALAAGGGLLEAQGVLAAAFEEAAAAGLQVGGREGTQGLVEQKGIAAGRGWDSATKGKNGRMSGWALEDGLCSNYWDRHKPKGTLLRWRV
jgi:hypothetical protein